MQQPVTELDTRFSDQNAVATDWEETRRALVERLPALGADRLGAIERAVHQCVHHRHDDRRHAKRRDDREYREDVFGHQSCWIFR